MPSHLFSPLSLKSVTLRNRILVSPMCQYSSHDGFPSAWHMVHLGSRAVGGAACVIQEATAVVPEGRISPADAGIWNDDQAEAYLPITQFLKENGAVPAIQLAHAGRKASVSEPWKGGGSIAPEKGGWETFGPSAVPFSDKSLTPHAMTDAQIMEVVQAFARAAQRSLKAGYQIVEIHAAHGYLLHEFLSPVSNLRTDSYGGSLENRMRLTLEVVAAVREVWPENLPVFVRISATDWVEKGWDVAQSIQLTLKLKEIGIDMIDVSSGGNVSYAKIVTGPGYQVPFASEIRKATNLVTGTVGMISTPDQAEKIIAEGQADLVLLARELLRDPYWPLHAADHLGVEVAWPSQYERATPSKAK